CLSFCNVFLFLTTKNDSGSPSTPLIFFVWVQVFKCCCSSRDKVIDIVNCLASTFKLLRNDGNRSFLMKICFYHYKLVWCKMGISHLCSLSLYALAGITI